MRLNLKEIVFGRSEYPSDNMLRTIVGDGIILFATLVEFVAKGSVSSETLVYAALIWSAIQTTIGITRDHRRINSLRPKSL